jgi:hypothetical protein
VHEQRIGYLSKRSLSHWREKGGANRGTIECRTAEKVDASCRQSANVNHIATQNRDAINLWWRVPVARAKRE